MSLFSTLSSIFVGPNQQQKSAKHGPVKPPQKLRDQRTLKHVPVEPIKLGHPSSGARPLSPTPSAPQRDDTSLRESQARAREIIVEAKDEALRLREKAEGEVRQLRQEISEKERSIDQKLSSLDQRLKALDSRDEELQKHRGELEKQEKGLEELKQSLVKKLEQAAGLSREQAKQQILENLEKKLDKEMATLIQTRENVAKEEADEKAKEILVDAMRHGATEYVTEYTVSVVKLPDEEVKGRIIGKDGRNIRAFEQATGVDIDLDDQPGQVRLSSFDPVRREIARITLEQLIKDGRIQPTRRAKSNHGTQENHVRGRKAVVLRSRRVQLAIRSHSSAWTV
ncbi:MAG: Ribonuclease Y [Microgenomates group bacterium GW2011_GWA1_46_15]|nr:MAG: Ribonuclease Y [Microgenomates group bacterium GW2011_GWA1_46_15]